MPKITFLNIGEVLEIHHDQIARYGGTSGLRDLDLLKSAVAMPQAAFDGEFHSHVARRGLAGSRGQADTGWYRPYHQLCFGRIEAAIADGYIGWPLGNIGWVIRHNKAAGEAAVIIRLYQPGRC